ncbi:MAG: amidase [Acidobacteria bacterium]|nr:amidase [Acidobacteriota bacterium]
MAPLASGPVFLLFLAPGEISAQAKPFDIMETTIEAIRTAYKSGQITSRQLVQLYLDRIEAYDRSGPAITSIITVNPKALEEAARLDAAFEISGFVGPLHGIPVIIKDQVDAAGMPTTLGSVLLKNYFPDKDAFVVEKLTKAGAIILAKATLGELGGGDTHGSLFGSTRNPYALDRTVGGSSGGPAAAVAANFATVSIGQEQYASISRPATWNSIVGMRPTPGLVSRSGVYSGWPTSAGTLGPMARTVQDAAALLDVLVGYDSEDPLTAMGAGGGRVPGSYTKFLDRNGLKGARLGILREPLGNASEPGSDDFRKIDEVFNRAVAELKAAGAAVVDPIVIPKLKELLAHRGGSPTEAEEAFQVYFGRSAQPPFRSREEAMRSPDFANVFYGARNRLRGSSDTTRHYQYLMAREELMIHLLKVMADNRLDAIVYKAVEHPPTLISQGVNPPYVNMKGAQHWNTFLVFVPTIVVPAGFTTDKLPAGITFLGRPYDEATVIRLAYAYEQATRHRRPPESTPPLQRAPQRP